MTKKQIPPEELKPEEVIEYAEQDTNGNQTQVREHYFKLPNVGNMQTSTKVIIVILIVIGLAILLGYLYTKMKGNDTDEEDNEEDWD